MSEGPRIRTIDWVPAAGVLGHEAYGFTPWLAANLGLVSDALGLPPLQLIATEQGLPPFRIDIVAVAEDETVDGMPVVIENQYGRTDHDHLGKLVTYLAGQQRGLAVWVAEAFADPHLAAIEFLNRTSDGSVGYALVKIRLAPAPDGEHYVDLEVLARPNDWLKSQPETTTAPHLAAPERVALLDAVHPLIEQPLIAAGWARVSVYSLRAARIELRLPADHPLQRAGYFTLRADRNAFRFRHVINGVDTLTASRAVVRALRDRYGTALQATAPDGTTIVWDVDVRKTQVNAQWQAEHPGGGYADLTPEGAAAWAVAVAGAWVRLLASDPPHGLVEVVSGTDEQG